ncbi:hypothetical protein Tco_0455540 [Tanacetum coccineum]
MRLGLLPLPKLATFRLTAEEKKRKRLEFLKEVFVTKDVKVDGMNRNLRHSEAQSDEEIFFSVAWVRAFNIREPIYLELCREFYATYEFDEVCTDDELQRLELYHVEELNEEGFDAYFQGGLRSDENFNARLECCIMITYGLCQRTTGYEKIQRNDLWLLSMFEDRHQNGYANVAWVIAKWMKRNGARSQRDSQICCGQFISKIARKSKVLTEETIRSLTPRVQRAPMQDLYERMGSMEIRQEAIERMEYIQSYHWDRYQGVFEHMVGVYSVPLLGDYKPPGYASPNTTSITSSIIHSNHHSSNMMMKRMSSVG